MIAIKRKIMKIKKVIKKNDTTGNIFWSITGIKKH